MKLHWAPISPNAHKALVAAHGRGLADRLELVATTPETVEADLSAANPLGRVPALITEGGETLYDSLAIREYLDHLAGWGLSPPPGPKRCTALRRHALGQGPIDAAPASGTGQNFEQTPQAMYIRGLPPMISP